MNIYTGLQTCTAHIVLDICIYAEFLKHCNTIDFNDLLGNIR